MSTFWSFWVMILVVLNLGIALFLFLWGPRVKIPTLPDGTSGHVWAHGTLREGVRALPRWWLAMSTAAFLFGAVYLYLYPGFGNRTGALHWSSQGELAKAQTARESSLGQTLASFGMYPVEKLSLDPSAQHIGWRLFDDNCAACHGRQAKGNVLLGAPNLTDNDWLYGGTGGAILTSIQNGRAGVMPPWASLGKQRVKDLAQYVLSLSNAPHDPVMAAAGKPLFTTCAACHGANGKGNQAIGAPNLTDGIWLHGGSVSQIEATIGHGRQGHMPAWKSRLGAMQMRAVAAYVYHLSHHDQTVSP